MDSSMQLQYTVDWSNMS